jgi:mono/diheme cytochrome c family protein
MQLSLCERARAEHGPMIIRKMKSRSDVRRFGIALAVLAGSSSIALPADVKKGEQLGRRWCASCHLVAADQSQANADVPSFLSIAQQPNFKSEEVAAFLLDQHPKMPNFSLSRQEIDNIAEYIASLAGKHRKDDPASSIPQRSKL